MAATSRLGSGLLRAGGALGRGLLGLGCLHGLVLGVGVLHDLGLRLRCLGTLGERRVARRRVGGSACDRFGLFPLRGVNLVAVVQVGVFGRLVLVLLVGHVDQSF